MEDGTSPLSKASVVARILKSSLEIPGGRRPTDEHLSKVIVEYIDLNAKLDYRAKFTASETLEGGSVPVTSRQPCGCHT